MKVPSFKLIMQLDAKFHVGSGTKETSHLNFHKYCALPDFYSEHSPVPLALNSIPNIMEYHWMLNSRSTNWQYFKELDSSTVPLSIEADVSNAIEITN